ncbi:LysE family transporter [Salinarimonas rosea]|uniref:LysE family transporter n=1 Tax=Salinarimonas rosea TaxID=552063 RepID=UPI0003FD906E|nr:LysE family transporter [Salinarimonas rosea]
MTVGGLAALFAAMAVLAAMPSASVLAVSARAAAGGFAQGAATALGVVAGDVVWLLVALFGLALLKSALGDWAGLIRWVGAAYVILVGIALARSAWRGPAATAPPESPGRAASFSAGLAITLADQKAVLFYLGFLPGFVDLARIGPGEAALLVVVIAVSVGGVKLAYAYAAARAGVMVGPAAGRALTLLAAAILVIVGIALLVGG